MFTVAVAVHDVPVEAMNRGFFELLRTEAPRAISGPEGLFDFASCTVFLLVEVERFELTTSRLQSGRSPTELHPRDR